jgi:hypothetical protein
MQIPSNSVSSVLMNETNHTSPLSVWSVKINAMDKEAPRDTDIPSRVSSSVSDFSTPSVEFTETNHTVVDKTSDTETDEETETDYLTRTTSRLQEIFPNVVSSVPINRGISRVVAPKRKHVAQNRRGLPSYRDLLRMKEITVGDRVFCSQRKGNRFYGDLLLDGRIRYSTGQTPALDLLFPSPTAFNNFCGHIKDASYEKGNGFLYTFHKGNEEKVWMPLDYYRWLAFGRSHYVYPKNFKRGENAVSSSASMLKNTLPFGFTEGDEEIGVSHCEHKVTDVSASV